MSWKRLENSTVFRISVIVIASLFLSPLFLSLPGGMIGARSDGSTTVVNQTPLVTDTGNGPQTTGDLGVSNPPPGTAGQPVADGKGTTTHKSGLTATDPSQSFKTTFTDVPTSIPGSNSVYSYDNPSSDPPAMGVGTVTFGDNTPVVTTSGGGGGGGGHGGGGGKGGKLGNAPEALYRVLEKFLAKGKAPPPNFPVPYVIHTVSDGAVEQFTDSLTKMPIMIDVDENHATGQGGKDVRVKTTIDVNPLTITTLVERLKTPSPTYLKVMISFPAFFYNGEAGAPEGQPYWMFGYETQAGYPVPEEITMKFTVDKTLGSDHTFNFTWTSSAGIPKLGFTFGVFQVLDRDLSAPILPAFSNFIVSSPPYAGLTFQTTETPTSSMKCMNWAAPSTFALSFDFGEIESLLGVEYRYPMTITVDKVPQSFSLCTSEDRAANTYSVDYTASSNIHLVEMVTEIDASGLPTVHIDLAIEEMPSALHMVLGDGYLNVDLNANIGAVRLDANADLGFAGIDSMANFRLRLSDIPDFSATWHQGSAGNGFALDAPSCIGTFELAFSFGDLVFPAEHTTAPASHYFFAWSDATKTAISLRLIGTSHIGFEQDNNIGANTVDLMFCGNNVMYIIAHSEPVGLLTPGHKMDLRIVIDLTPTEVSFSWTVPFAFTLTLNDAIDSITADLTLDDLVAHAEIMDLPASVSWTINPAGSIAFTAGATIGKLLLDASSPSGLPGAGGFFGGSPIKLFHLVLHDLNSFTATWSSESVTPWTSFSFMSLLGLGDLTFAVSTSTSNYVTHLGAEGIRAAFYNDDTINLGSGLVMEASIWITANDVTRAALSWGGSTTTVIAGFGTTAPVALSFAAQLDGASPLNPASPKPLTAHVTTSNLPTSMDLTLVPESSFDYLATSSISSIVLEADIGVLPALTHIFGTIEGVPDGASGDWTANSIDIALSPSSSLSRIYLLVTNPTGLFSTSYKRLEVEVKGVPRTIGADWDLAAKTASLDFGGGVFSGGLGSFKALVTAQDEAPTTAYINGLGGAPPVCMTTYSGFTSTIDQRYWTQGTGSAASRQTIVDDIRATYCRAPTLDISADDYVVYLNSPSGNILALKVRELNKLSATLDQNVGNAEVRFTDGTTLSRQLYVRTENGASHSIVLAEASKLPDGAGPNRLALTWNVPGNSFSYDISEVLPFLDIYLGPSDPTPLDVSFTKMVFVNVPATGSLAWDLHLRSSGFLNFIVSSEFEFGIVRQESSGTRYVAFVKMSGLHFNYSIRLPGEGPCSGSYDVCYPILHINIDIHTDGGPLNGILGIYSRKGSLLSLTPPGPAPTDPDFVPQWTFTVTGFTHFTFKIDWDAGFAIDLDWCGPIPCWITVDVTILPVITFSTDLNPWVDFWWNDKVEDSTSVLGITFYYKINIADYTNSDPVDLFPVTGLYADGPSINISLSDIKAGVEFELHGLHQQSEHGNPGF